MWVLFVIQKVSFHSLFELMNCPIGVDDKRLLLSTICDLQPYWDLSVISSFNIDLLVFFPYRSQLQYFLSRLLLKHACLNLYWILTLHVIIMLLFSYFFVICQIYFYKYQTFIILSKLFTEKRTLWSELFNQVIFSKSDSYKIALMTISNTPTKIKHLKQKQYENWISTFDFGWCSLCPYHKTFPWNQTFLLSYFCWSEDNSTLILSYLGFPILFCSFLEIKVFCANHQFLSRGTRSFMETWAFIFIATFLIAIWIWRIL